MGHTAGAAGRPGTQMKHPEGVRLRSATPWATLPEPRADPTLPDIPRLRRATPYATQPGLRADTIQPPRRCHAAAITILRLPLGPAAPAERSSPPAWPGGTRPAPTG